ncbi:techylectin-5A-like [Apostichopus japonicus]|uniref:techylectin-5A-like n=1 Tax=Stichopus japonicus TaxID=307972 RepID=UPI003AB575EA
MVVRETNILIVRKSLLTVKKRAVCMKQWRRKVIQRRMDVAQDFNLYWSDYKEGFGNIRENFWLGNDKIYSLKNQRRYELRIDLGNVASETFYAVYYSFYISDESQEYTLRLGAYSGDAVENTLGSVNFADISTSIFRYFMEGVSFTLYFFI